MRCSSRGDDGSCLVGDAVVALGPLEQPEQRVPAAALWIVLVARRVLLILGARAEAALVAVEQLLHDLLPVRTVQRATIVRGTLGTQKKGSF